MKIVIPSKGRPFTIKTHEYLKGFDYTIVLHSEEEKQQYLMNSTIPPEKIIVSNQPTGIARQRNWIQDNLIAKDEWYISLDDNIEGFTCVTPEYYEKDTLDVTNKETNWKEIFERRIDAREFLELCELLALKGELENAYNIGFAVVDNPYFRGKHIRYVGYVISKAVIRKNVGIRFNETTNSMEDYAYTAECLLQHGKVMIDNFIFPIAKHYESGGIGTYEERVFYKIKDSKILMRQYPDLFRYKEKADCHPEAEVQIRFTDTAQVEEWRQKLLAGKHGWF